MPLKKTISRRRISMIINHNVPAMNTNRQLAINDNNTSKSLEKLSSGLRINRAGDDAAGLAISEKMRSQIRGLDQASRNAQDDISLIQTAEGAMGTIEEILQRMKELAVQSSNDTNTTSDRVQIQTEINAITAEISRIATVTEFNTQKLLNGTFSNKVFHIGANASQSITISIASMSAASLGVSVGTASAGKTINFTTQSSANVAISALQIAIDSVSTARAKLGAIQNRLEYTVQNLGVASENTSSAESRIRDVDMSKEMMSFTKNNILSQAATAMLAQANQMPQNVLSLLR